jgi:hypothetical protein
VWQKGDPAPFAFDGNTFVQDAIPDGAGFIAVGYSIVDGGITGRIWRTADGRSWRLVEGDWFSNVQFDQILSVGSGVVIVGIHRQPDVGEATGPMTPAIWSSSDGTSWTERTPEGAEDLFIDSAAGGRDGLLLSATDRDGHRFWLRADAGFQWTRLAMTWPDDVRISGIASGGPGWIATGVTGIDTEGSTGGTSKGAIWTSADGDAWTPATIEEPGGTMSTVTRVGGGYVATGSDQNVACTVCAGPITFTPLVTWSSSDGLSWRRTGEFQPSIGSLIGGTFAANDGQRMQVFGSGVDRRLMISETLDGVHWHEIAIWHEAGMSAADVEAFPDFRVPFVGSSGLIAFGDGSAAESGLPVTPVPWFASVSDAAPSNAATFPPRPEPSLSDVPCPNQEPCGP